MQHKSTSNEADYADFMGFWWNMTSVPSETKKPLVRPAQKTVFLTEPSEQDANTVVTVMSDLPPADKLIIHPAHNDISLCDYDKRGVSDIDIQVVYIDLVTHGQFILIIYLVCLVYKYELFN